MTVLGWAGVAAGLTVIAVIAVVVAGVRLMEMLDEPVDGGDL